MNIADGDIPDAAPSRARATSNAVSDAVVEALAAPERLPERKFPRRRTPSIPPFPDTGESWPNCRAQKMKASFGNGE